MKITQIENVFFLNSNEANTWLRAYQQKYPKRKIINISTTPWDPEGWFMTIVYEVEV